jgi:hypothetical protein
MPVWFVRFRRRIHEDIEEERFPIVVGFSSRRVICAILSLGMDSSIAR